MYRRNLFGATLGAPVLHDKLFFFGDYQGILQRIGVTRISTVPTVAERAGNFSGVSKIYNPEHHLHGEHPSDARRVSQRHHQHRRSIRRRLHCSRAFPLPTSTGAANNYTRVANDDDHQQQFDITRRWCAKGLHDRAFARYTYYHEVEQPATPLPDGSGVITGSVLGAGNVSGLTHM